MPINTYKSSLSLFEEDSQELPGEMTFRDYFAQFAADGILPGYRPNVELVIGPKAGSNNSPDRTAFIDTAKTEILAYLTGGKIGGSDKVKYKRYQGGPYRVNATANSIFISFVNEETARSFVKVMHGHFAIIEGASEQNADCTAARRKAGYTPESDALRIHYGLEASPAVVTPKATMDNFVPMTDAEARNLADQYLAAVAAHPPVSRYKASQGGIIEQMIADAAAQIPVPVAP